VSAGDPENVPGRGPRAERVARDGRARPRAGAAGLARNGDSDQSGAVTRGYCIVRFVGAGGAAAVYEARRVGPAGPGERLAYKVLRGRRRNDAWHRAALRHEGAVGLCTTAGHPNMVEVLEVFEDARDQPCVVMELVDGVCLADLCEPHRRLPFPIVRCIAVDVLEALVHLHRRDVLHRDLSTANILITAGGVAKVADLGLARVMQQGRVHTQCRGTPMYASPEAIQGLALDARADLFSLGAILYELVSGAPPCGYLNTIGAMLAANAAGTFAPAPPDTPVDLAELITGLIRKDRDARRPAAAAEGLALLRGHGQPTASPAELSEMVATAQQRHEQALAAMRPDSALEPGHILVPRDARAMNVAPVVALAVTPAAAPAARPVVHGARPVEAAAAAPPGRVTGGMPALVDAGADDALSWYIEDAPGALPGQVDVDAPGDDVAAPSRHIAGEGDAVPDYVAGGEDVPLLDHMAGLVAEAAFDHSDDHVGEDAEKRTPENGTPEDEVIEASPASVHRHAGTARLVAWRAIAVVAIAACIVLLTLLLDDVLRDERRASRRSGGPARWRGDRPTPIRSLRARGRGAGRCDGARGARVCA
jgi:hypothetical protein